MSTRIPSDAGERLLPIARAAIAHDLGVDASAVPPPPHDADADTGWLTALGASFVTLTEDGALRGCIGSLIAHRPLGEDVASNARAAAFHDPRFSPVTPREFEHVEVEVSVLSTPEPLPFRDRADLEATLRPGVDGLILTADGDGFGARRGTFLPQVWDDLPDRSSFLDQLVRKAGLPAGYWDDDAISIERYTVTAWREGGDRP